MFDLERNKSTHIYITHIQLYKKKKTVAHTHALNNSITLIVRMQVKEILAIRSKCACKMSCFYRYASASNCAMDVAILPLLACHAIVISPSFFFRSIHTHECAPASNETADAIVISWCVPRMGCGPDIYQCTASSVLQIRASYVRKHTNTRII